MNAIAGASAYGQGDLVCFHARHVWQLWREPEVLCCPPRTRRQAQPRDSRTGTVHLVEEGGVYFARAADVALRGEKEGDGCR